MKRFFLLALLYLASVGVALAATGSPSTTTGSTLEGGGFPPAPGDYGLRGDFNGFGLTPMSFDAATSTYSVNISLDPGSYNFKISDNDWSDPITFGNPGGLGPLLPGTTTGIDIAVGFGTDLTVDIANAGIYNFSLDLSGWTDTGANDAFLTISQIPLPGALLLFGGALAGLGLLRRRV